MIISLRELAALAISTPFIRFALVGCLNVAVSFSVFYACYRLWPLATVLLTALGDTGTAITTNLAEIGITTVDATFANVLGYMAGVINSFILNKLWTFNAQGDLMRQMHRFILLNLLGLAVSTLIVFIFVDLLGGPYLVTWFFAIVTVMVLNFLGQKHWAFSDGLSYKVHH